MFIASWWCCSQTLSVNRNQEFNTMGFILVFSFLSLLHLLFLMVRNPASIYLFIYLVTSSVCDCLLSCHPFPLWASFLSHLNSNSLGTEHLYLLTDNWLWATEALPLTLVLMSSLASRSSFRTDSFRRGGRQKGKRRGLSDHLLLNGPSNMIYLLWMIIFTVLILKKEDGIENILFTLLPTGLKVKTVALWRLW